MALATALVLAGAPAEPASVKSVQTGAVTMSSATQTATLGTAVTASRAFVVCSSRTNSSNASQRATCELTGGGTTVTVTTNEANAAQVVQWHVVEFDGGVTVQRGVASFGTTAGTVDVPVASVATAAGLAKSFHLLTERTTSTSQVSDEEWTIRGVLETTGGGRLRLTRNDTGIAVSVAWQVIEMEGATVQRGLDSIAGGSASRTVTIGSINTASSFLVYSRRGPGTANGVETSFQARGAITSPTQVTFTRAGTTGALNISWEVVSLDDGTTVQRGTSSTAAVTDETLNAALSAIDQTVSVPLITVSGGGGGTADLDSTSYTATFSSNTNLQLERVSSQDANAQVAWEVVSFFKCGSLANVDYASVTAKDNQAIVRWQSTQPVLILRKTSAFGTEAPAHGTAYSVSGTIGAATVVYNGALVENQFTDTGATNGGTYFYRVFARSDATSTTACYASGAGTDLTARPVATGTGVQWSHMLAGGASLRAPASGDGQTVYYASNANRLVGLYMTHTPAAMGTQLWTPVATSGAVQGMLTWLPVSAGGAQLIAGDGTGTVQAVNAQTGATMWTTALPGTTSVQASVSAQLRAYSDAAFAAAYSGTYDVLFVGSRNATTNDNKVFALRSDTGAVLWTFNQSGTFSMDGIVGQPWVDYVRNRVYVTTLAAGGSQPSLWILDSLTGSLVGPCPGTGCFSLGDIQAAPTLSFLGDRLWVGTTGGDLYSINLETLTQNWTSPAALGASAALKGFVWEDWSTANLLYFSTADGNVWALQDPYVSGAAVAPPNPASPVWKRAVAGASTILPLDAIYVGSSDGKVHRIDMATGVDVKQFTVGDGTRAVGDCSTQDGFRLFVGTTEGTVYEITLPLP